MAAHPDTELIPYVHGELPAPERERIAQHLRECLDCRRDADELRELLDDLGRAVPRPPDVHWGGYRAELREKLAARRTRRAWWARPVPLALSASFTGLLLVVAFLTREGSFLTRMRVIERLRMLETLPVLDSQTPTDASRREVK